MYRVGLQSLGGTYIVGGTMTFYHNGVAFRTVTDTNDGQTYTDLSTWGFAFTHGSVHKFYVKFNGGVINGVAYSPSTSPTLTVNVT